MNAQPTPQTGDDTPVPDYFVHLTAFCVVAARRMDSAAIESLVRACFEEHGVDSERIALFDESLQFMPDLIDRWLADIVRERSKPQAANDEQASG